MQLWLPLFTVFAYVAAAAGFVRVYRKPQRRINPLWVLGILVCACQGHALSLIVSLQANNHLNLSVFNMVSVNAWFVACISVFWLWRASMALGGVVPFLSFIVEKRIHAETLAQLDANPQATKRY